jgi:hypothetical protein
MLPVPAAIGDKRPILHVRRPLYHGKRRYSMKIAFGV